MMVCHFKARVVKWQTRAFKGRMPKGVGVRVPPRADFHWKYNASLTQIFHTGSWRGAANHDADTTGGRETAAETALALRGQP